MGRLLVVVCVVVATCWARTLRSPSLAHRPHHSHHMKASSLRDLEERYENDRDTFKGLKADDFTRKFYFLPGASSVPTSSRDPDTAESSSMSSSLLPNAMDESSSIDKEGLRSAYSTRMASSGASLGADSVGSMYEASWGQALPTATQQDASILGSSTAGGLGAGVASGVAGLLGWNVYSQIRPRTIYLKLPVSEKDDTIKEVTYKQWRGPKALFREIGETFHDKLEGVLYLEDTNVLADDQHKQIYTKDIFKNPDLLQDSHLYIVHPAEIFSGAALEQREMNNDRSRVYVRVPDTPTWKNRLSKRECVMEAVEVYQTQRQLEEESQEKSFYNRKEVVPSRWRLSDMPRSFTIPESASDTPFDHLADKGCGGVKVGRYFWYMREKQIEGIFNELRGIRPVSASLEEDPFADAGVDLQENKCMSFDELVEGLNNAPDALSQEIPDFDTLARRISMSQTDSYTVAKEHTVEPEFDDPLDIETFTDVLWSYEPLTEKLVGKAPPIYVWAKTPQGDQKRRIPDDIKAGHSFSFDYHTYLKNSANLHQAVAASHCAHHDYHCRCTPQPLAQYEGEGEDDELLSSARKAFASDDMAFDEYDMDDQQHRSFKKFMNRNLF